MTREEHIYQLKQYLQGKSISMCPASSLYWQEHWEEVIKALEQEPTTKNDLGVDAVSRQAVLYLIADYDLSMGQVVKGIHALPSVTPQEPKTGHWEWVQYDYNPKLGNWHCSECRCIVVECVDKEEKGGIPLYKYCPQCGAKMD